MILAPESNRNDFAIFLPECVLKFLIPISMPQFSTLPLTSTTWSREYLVDSSANSFLSSHFRSNPVV